MPIKLRKNIYNGVNAHLHSSLQNEDSAWDSFCALHTVDIAVYIDKILPTTYIVQPERSLQISEYPISQDDYLKAVAIRGIKDNEIGEVVARIELLALNSKDKDYTRYNEKRIAALKSGILLVEIDYLHETRLLFSPIPSYPDQENGSSPYWIVISDPRPTLAMGTVNIYGFQVDQNIPTIQIPLNNTDLLLLDFGSVYNQTFESLKAFSYRVDYEQLPVKFDTYNATDQKHILAVMERAKAISANLQND